MSHNGLNRFKARERERHALWLVAGGSWATDEGWTPPLVISSIFLLASTATALVDASALEVSKQLLYG